MLEEEGLTDRDGFSGSSHVSHSQPDCPALPRINSRPSVPSDWVHATCAPPPNITRAQCSDIPGLAQMATICRHTTDGSEPGTTQAGRARGVGGGGGGSVYLCAPLVFVMGLLKEHLQP